MLSKCIYSGRWHCNTTFKSGRPLCHSIGNESSSFLKWQSEIRMVIWSHASLHLRSLLVSQGTLYCYKVITSCKTDPYFWIWSVFLNEIRESLKPLKKEYYFWFAFWRSLAFITWYLTCAVIIGMCLHAKSKVFEGKRRMSCRMCEKVCDINGEWLTESQHHHRVQALSVACFIKLSYT